jgi:polyferredoxin
MAWIGRWLFAVGVIHLSFGLVFMHRTLALLWSERLWNTVNGQPPREAVFWFLCTGVLLLIIGVIVDRAERDGLAIPRFAAWLFAALTIVGVVVMPISGIWLLIPPAVGMVYRRRPSTEE